MTIVDEHSVLMRRHQINAGETDASGESLMDYDVSVYTASYRHHKGMGETKSEALRELADELEQED